MKKLSIILGTYNRLPKLKKCLSSILGKIKTDYQLVIIDAGSNDGTINFVEKFGKPLRLIKQNKRIGQVKSFNRYLPKIKSEYVCWISDDNVVVVDVLDEAVKTLDNNKAIGMVGLKVKDMTGRFKNESYIGGIWPSGILNMNQGVIRSDLFRKLKYFDSEFPDYGIDADLTTRVLMEGYKVVLTKKIGVFHFRGYDNTSKSFEKSVRNNKLHKALVLYRRKYRKICQRKRITSFYSFIFYPIFSLILKFTYCCLLDEIPFSKNNSNRDLRDWMNLLSSRYINILDFWYNRHNSFYFEQDIRNSKILRYYGKR
jgi:GT2 family glycosyltransferase